MYDYSDLYAGMAGALLEIAKNIVLNINPVILAGLALLGLIIAVEIAVSLFFTVSQYNLEQDLKTLTPDDLDAIHEAAMENEMEISYNPHMSREEMEAFNTFLDDDDDEEDY